jgi:hypothetical protein
VPEVNDPAVREVIHGPYRIIYEILHDPDTIYVLRFWHGAREFRRFRELVGAGSGPFDPFDKLRITIGSDSARS